MALELTVLEVHFSTSVGLIAGLEMVKDKSKREKFPTTVRAGIFFREAAFRNGLVLRAIGDTVVASPPMPRLTS